MAKVSKADQKTLDFLKTIKENCVDSKSRKRYEGILREIKENLLNTTSQKAVIDQSNVTNTLVVQMKPDGSRDFAIMPKMNNRKGGDSDVPRSAIPIALSKVLVATAALGTNTPDGTTYSLNKIKARLFKDIWKMSVSKPEMNAANTFIYALQQMLLTGTGAWRVYPKRTTVETTGPSGEKVSKLIYDDIYREPLDMTRTWLGPSYKPFSDDGRPEVYWETDITNVQLKKLKKQFKKKNKSVDELHPSGDGVSEESEAFEADANKLKSTLRFYENPLENRYIVATMEEVLYDGEMPNQELYGSVVIEHAWHTEHSDQYGFGLYELIRGDQTLLNYIVSSTAEQVEAEIRPIVFVSGAPAGEMNIMRSANKANLLPAGAKVESVLTTGNSVLGMNFAKEIKLNIDENTGVNNVVAGASAESTLGGTVIMKEAALNRLICPRNSHKRAIEKDFCIHMSWVEQDQIHPRENIFDNEQGVNDFKQLNKMWSHQEEPFEYSDDGVPLKFAVYSSPKIPLSFDYNKADMEESGYQDMPTTESGDSSFLRPRSEVLGNVAELESEDKVGYDKVYLNIDPNSLLIPSIEIQKQTSMQLYPLISDSLMKIFGMAKMEPEQAVAQLISFKKFLEVQREQIFDYIPKDLYDKIMQMGMVPPPMIDPMTGMPVDPNMGPMPGQPGGKPGDTPMPPANNNKMGKSLDGGMSNIMGRNAARP